MNTIFNGLYNIKKKYQVNFFFWQAQFITTCIFFKESLKKCKTPSLATEHHHAKIKDRQEKWLSERDPSRHQYSLWCREGSDEYHVYCFICRKEFGCYNSGQLQLKQHPETQTHKKKSRSVLSSSQSKLVVTKSQATSSANSSQIGQKKNIC
jgi:hypothetical protein